MKVIGFVGSPRKNGNTDLLVQQVLQGAVAAGAESKVFYLNDLNFRGCQGCGSCKVNDKCIQQDDMTALYEEINEADAIILGSPVYMWQISGQTKLFIDRLYAFISPDFSSRLKKGKQAVLIFSQGNPDSNLFRQSFASLGEILKLGGLELKDTLVASGVVEAGEVAKNEALMQKARALGEQLVK